MSKIYEALEQAEKEKKVSEEVQASRVEAVQEPAQIQERMQEIDTYSFEMEMEEEMLHLYQTIEALLPQRRKRAVQFIGSGEGEGTSTIIREFAKIAVATLGQTVLLLDADRHNPTQHFFCSVSPDHCLDEVVQACESAEKALYQVGTSKLFVSLISRNSNSGMNFFDSSGFDAVWDTLRERFDLILIDSPPATSSSDAFALCRRVDGVVLVVEADKTRWPVAQSVKERIIQHGGNVLGMVLNKRRYYIPGFIYNRL
ncbi:MAG: CpsD/CapB family tyrosine-protein kinase [Syntrophorhabdales bacterium]|jgi:Mrp family chromosome partitioning ATPase